MSREVDISGYWPPYLHEYLEMDAIARAENPELQKLQDEAARQFENQFFMHCDERGIARFEKMLGIAAAEDEGLPFRRERVWLRWNDDIPYTYRVLLRHIVIICGQNFVIDPRFAEYELWLQTYLTGRGQLAELRQLLEHMLPANILYTVNNTAPIEAEAKLYTATVMANVTIISIPAPVENP